MNKYIVTFKLKDKISLIVNAEEGEAREEAINYFRKYFYSEAYKAFFNQIDILIIGRK